MRVAARLTEESNSRHDWLSPIGDMRSRRGCLSLGLVSCENPFCRSKRADLPLKRIALQGQVPVGFGVLYRVEFAVRNG